MENALSVNPAERPSLMKRDFGVVSRYVAGRFFEPIPLSQDGEALLRRCAEEGELVHVMRSSGVLNFLYLAHVLIRHGLPALRAAVNLQWTFWKPYRRIHRHGSAADQLSAALDGGNSALVFLRDSSGRTPPRVDEPFLALISRARRSDRPIFLVPELFLWGRTARNVKPGLVDLLFGSPEAPGMLHTAAAFLRNYRNAFMRVGRPINLTQFVRENAADSDEVLARKVRGALSQHLARETRAIVGPPRKDRARMIDEILRDRQLRTAIESISAETKQSPESVRRTVVRYLKEIASRPSPFVIDGAKYVLRWVFQRIYDGIVVDEEGLNRALDISREAPVVFCPSHKSHIDYLVMSWVLVERGISPPLVAAGANLSFFPLGTFLRRAGAYFLRRTFKGNRAYAAAFRGYVKKLLREGYSQEFFIEGGRSRTGKLLSPKLGMVAFEVEAFLGGAQDDLYFVPMAIDYEKVVEAREYASELSGGEKKPESIKSLLSAPRVLTARYGRIYLSFEEPISLREFLRQRAGSLDKLESLDEEKRRAAVRALAQRITFGISRASTVTPAALLAAALLAKLRRGVTAREVGARIHFLRELAERENARLSPVMERAPSDPTSLGPINEVLRMFMEDGWVRAEIAGGETIYSVPDDRRLSLAFYKNNLVHLVVSRSLVAAALLSLGGKGPTAEISERSLFLSRLLKLEFMFKVGVPFEALFRETVEALAAEGLLLDEGEVLLAAPEPHVERDLAFLRNLTLEFIEGYRTFAAVLERAASPIDRKELIKSALDRGRADFLSGSVAMAEAISRPTMENALAYFLDQEVLVEAGDRRVVLAEAYRSESARQGLLAQIDRFLVRE